MAKAAPAIVIAAGGDGTRMGGRKPLQMLGGRPLIDHAIGWAMRHSDCVAIAARRIDDIPLRDLPVLIDRQVGIGPISALASAFRFASDQGRNRVIMVGCDMPFLPDDLVTRLATKLGGHATAMPVSNGRLHPMAALWTVDEAAIAGFIAQGERSLWRFAETVGMVRVEWQGIEDPFVNINDSIGLADAERRLQQKS